MNRILVSLAVCMAVILGVPSTATAETAFFEDRLSVVRVVHTSDETATARVTELRDAGMRPGAPVRRVERMPQ